MRFFGWFRRKPKFVTPIELDKERKRVIFLEKSIGRPAVGLPPKKVNPTQKQADQAERRRDDDDDWVMPFVAGIMMIGSALEHTSETVTQEPEPDYAGGGGEYGGAGASESFDSGGGGSDGGGGGGGTDP